MKTNSTTNQLGLAPIRMPNTRRSWIDEPVPSIAGILTGAPGGPAGRARALPRLRRMPRDDRLRVDARRQRAVLQPAVAGQARGAERVGHGGRRVAHEKRALQRERHLLDDAARAAP